MNIIYWSDATLPSRAANTVHIMKMGQALAENGHNVTLLARRKNDQYAEKQIYDYYGVKHSFNLELISTYTGRGGGLFYALHGLNYVMKKKPDLVFGRSVYGCFLTAMFTRKTVIIEMHDMMEGNRIFKMLFRCMMHRKNLKNVVVITERLADCYRKKYKTIANKLLVAPDGADEVCMQNTSHELLVNNENARFNIGYIGSLYKGRGIELILEIAKALPNDFFHIIGGSEAEVIGWKKITHNTKNIVFYGQIPPAEVPKYGCCMDILLAPYQNNVFSSNSVTTTDTVNYMSPMKIFEYMSFGKVIIASNLPAIREVLRNEENAMLCDPLDVTKWVGAIERLWNEKDLKIRLENTSLKELQDNYTWKERARRVLKE